MTSNSTSSSAMDMVFFYSNLTPLFTDAWTPSGTGAYAGTCIFLIIFTVIHRALVAFRNTVFAPPKPRHEMDSIKALSTSRFNAGKEIARGIIEVMIGAIGYLLMIAVMTMNVGYFSSVLAGIFLGAFLVGRYDGSPSCSS
ncbi:Ctr copper transporter [Xylariales sp. PMI_506]|nr:Ctr copper transporter [Xylariales sp. PMI_506]